MATTPVDQQRSILFAAALFAAALTIFAGRSIRSSRQIEALPLPAADVQAVSSFLAPLPDTSGLATPRTGTIVVARDPFVAMSAAGAGVPSRMTANASSPKTAEGQRWVVSTILFEGSRKSAIVNDAWVSVGDSLPGGSRLTSVERDHIIVTDARGIRHVVPIQGGEQ